MLDVLDCVFWFPILHTSIDICVSAIKKHNCNKLTFWKYGIAHASLIVGNMLIFIFSCNQFDYAYKRKLF